MKRLVIYNLETNLDSNVLAAAHDWIESFAKNVDQVVVYSTHVGRIDLPPNVIVREIGGGSPARKVIAVLRLLKSVAIEFPNRNTLTVFHHMSTRSLLIVGLFYKLMGVRQGLWYSHSKKSFTLSASHILADRIFTSTPSAIPISNSRVKFVGHGLKSERFLRNDFVAFQKRNGIVAIGRVVPVKRIELLVEAVSTSKLANLGITCIGPHEANGNYPNKILELARTKGIDVSLRNAIPYKEIPNTLLGFDFIFTGTPKSVDKAVIEGAMCGCFVISSEEQAIKLTGMDQVFKSLGFESTPTIENQLIAINSLASDQKENLRSILSTTAAELNDLDQTTQKILVGLGLNL